MKKTRLMSAFLATAVLSGVIGSVPVIAEEDMVVYTYQNEQGETVNVTQSEIDAGHWNVDALGDTLPMVYEDFPVDVNSVVNDFAELKLRLQYLKNLDKEDEFSNLTYVLDNLSKKEKEIMYMRYGFGGKEEMTQKQVADYFDISQSYISRIEKKILDKMKIAIMKLA